MSTATLALVDLQRTIQNWGPADHPVHCSNCLFAKVSGPPAAPQVWCAQGHGRERDWHQLWRARSPSGFRAAAGCPGFTSMDDDDA